VRNSARGAAFYFNEPRQRAMPNRPTNTEIKKHANELAEELFKEPPKTMDELATDTMVRERIGRIITLFLSRKKKTNAPK
jgi:hypothetical protein